MSNLIEFAKNELKIIEDSCKDDAEGLKMQQAIDKNILDIIEMFSKQGHSGSTAMYTINMLDKLLSYKPITPLTGEDNEWEKLDYGDDIAYQNKRCPSVFKTADGKCYNTEAKVFSDDNGHTWYTSGDSREYITFPYEVPTNPESVLINNNTQREQVLDRVKTMIETLTETKIENEIDEDDLLEDYLPRDKWLNLQNMYVNTYSLKHLLQDIQFIINEDIFMWEIINFILNSEVEEEVTSNDSKE